MRPQLDELTATTAALAMGQPYSTVARWLSLWFAAGVEGIRKVPAKARGGVAYRVDPSLVQRWRDGDLPEPRSVAA